MNSNYSFIHSYSLISQTPLIHFQWRPKGATLRPSEVKPKLDKFIAKTFVKEGKSIPEEWYNSQRTGTLDYKMQIFVVSENEWIDMSKIKSYFASITKDEEKRAIIANCRMDIICHIPGLAKAIEENIKRFFILTVFGARQSKGFGGFLVEETTDEEIYETIACEYGTFLYADFPENSGKTDKLNHVYTVYSVMKNGINRSAYSEQTGQYRFPDRYIKGYAMRDFLPAETGSDKAFMKSAIVDNLPLRNSEKTPEYKEFTFIRAMLGLAESYFFRKRSGGIAKIRFFSYDGTKIADNALEIPLDSLRFGGRIEKFRSPVSFRIFGDRMYIFMEETYTKMKNRIFVFLDEEKYALFRQCRRAEERKQVLETCPYISTPKDFDPSAFLCGFADYFVKNKLKLGAFYQEGRTDEFSASEKLVLNTVKGEAAR